LIFVQRRLVSSTLIPGRRDPGRQNLLCLAHEGAHLANQHPDDLTDGVHERASVSSISALPPIMAWNAGRPVCEQKKIGYDTVA
jgi:hypothetical protein